MQLSELASRLAPRLEKPLPGHEAHLLMSPRSPTRRDDLAVDDRECREAGVLVLLVQDRAEFEVVLTVRRDHLPDHGGQISFPGGQRENDEALQWTALREANEEVALDPETVDVLGTLTPLYIPPSNFCVHPFVGVVTSEPTLRPDDVKDDEVERVLQAPLPHLLNPSTRKTKQRSLHGQTIEVPYYAVSGFTVWGATAMMLAEFLATVRDVMPESTV